VASLFDPTGAGDSFAGGFMGYLTMTDSLSRENLRRAVVFGTALASFCVEDFSVGRLTDLPKTAIDARVAALRQMTEFTPDTQWLHSR
jgi:sugar/nucleoside kinase (ribokinase family)